MAFCGWMVYLPCSSLWFDKSMLPSYWWQIFYGYTKFYLSIHHQRPLGFSSFDYYKHCWYDHLWTYVLNSLGNIPTDRIVIRQFQIFSRNSKWFFYAGMRHVTFLPATYQDSNLSTFLPTLVTWHHCGFDLTSFPIHLGMWISSTVAVDTSLCSNM